MWSDLQDTKYRLLLITLLLIMLVLITQFILIISLIGMGVIFIRKIPILIELPEIFEEPETKGFVLKLEKKIKNISFLKSFSFEMFLQKTLSKVKVLSLKTENRADSLLQKLRKNSQKKKIEKNDKYWEQLKKSPVSSLRSLSKKQDLEKEDLKEGESKE